MKRLIILLLIPVILTSCSTMRKTFGVDKTPPDEFAVVERAPLTVPPDFNLVPPQPGAPRPQELRTTAQAQQLVIGNNAPVTTKDMSSAERSLLSQAGAGNVNAQIRQDLRQPEDDDVDGSVAQQLGIVEGGQSGKALNANDESRRLKKDNIKTPNVPEPKPAL